MDNELYTAHTARLKSPEAVGLYERLCNAIQTKDGEIGAADQTLCCDAAVFEDVKGQLIRDIAERGVGRVAHNGRQTYYAENKSVAMLRTVSEQQRKLLAELRITRSKRGAGEIAMNDDFETFDD